MTTPVYTFYKDIYSSMSAYFDLNITLPVLSAGASQKMTVTAAEMEQRTEES